MTSDSLDAPIPALPIEYDPVPDALPRPRNGLAKLIADYNPFYFLSACCMLLGCFVMNNALDWSPLPQENLLILIATLNLYEIALIALGLFLIKRGLERDGLFLLLIEAFFLADAGFLNMEIFTMDAQLGLIVNAVILVLAAAKLAVIFSVLGISLLDGVFTVVAMELMVLLAIPGILAAVSQHMDGKLPPAVIYASWWAVGLLPVLYSLLAHRELEPSVQRAVVRAFALLPLVSLVAHLCLSNWVYDVTFHVNNFSPLLLGLAIFAGGYDHHVATATRRMRLHLVMPFTAIALAAIRPPPELIFNIGGFPFSPLRLTLLAAAAVYLDGWILHRHVTFAWASMISLACVGIGPSAKSAPRDVAAMTRTIGEVLRSYVPKTSAQWGVISIVSAFLLLGAGAIVSMMRIGRLKEH